MSARTVLLVNPTITSRRHARFPLSIMTMAAALEGSHDSMLIDGNMDRDAVRSVLDAVGRHRFDAVGVTDNFFEIGGDSLAATRIAAALSDELGLDVDTVAVLEAPSVAELASTVASGDQLAASMKG